MLSDGGVNEKPCKSEWLHCPTGVGFMRYNRDMFADFLVRHGMTVGTCPTLPDYCVEVPEEEFKQWVRQGLEKWTYFARGKWTGRIKIGKSNNPSERMRTLPSSNYGEEAELLATLRGEHFESAYHNAFRDWHEGHEWFAPHPDILAEIDRLNAGAPA
jgi:hypothetical protein